MDNRNKLDSNEELKQLINTVDGLLYICNIKTNNMEKIMLAKKKGVLQTLGESLFEKYGAEEAFRVSASTHIISCPGCGKSWCD